MGKQHNLSFSTFLKLLELDGASRRSALKGLLRGGGYNYWRPLQQLAPDVAQGSMQLDEIQQKVAQLSKGHQRKYNQKALVHLLEWCSRRKYKSRKLLSGPIERKLGNSGLILRVNPELHLSQSDRDYWVQIWATNNPSLEDETLSMGLHMLRACMKKNGFEGRFLIFDAVKKRMFSEIDMLDDAPELLVQECREISDTWEELSGVPKPKESPAHPETPSDRPQAEIV